MFYFPNFHYKLSKYMYCLPLRTPAYIFIYTCMLTYLHTLYTYIYVLLAVYITFLLQILTLFKLTYSSVNLTCRKLLI